MTLLSASDDLRERTLSEFGCALEKLAYLARLREPDGQYRHWGMSRTYGEQAAGAAMAELHAQVWLEVLRTPIPDLFRQFSRIETSERVALMEESKKLRNMSYPDNLSGGGIRHFSSVLLALESLSKSAVATPRAA